MCQLKCIHEIGEKESRLDLFLELLRMKLRKHKRLVYYLKNKLSKRQISKDKIVFKPELEKVTIRRGDIVKVRSKEEIWSLLDEQEKYKGCPFMENMFDLCEKEYKVLKEVSYFYDENKQKLCKCKDLFILKGAHCSGRKRLYLELCDLNCFFFWHRDWLVKI